MKRRLGVPLWCWSLLLLVLLCVLAIVAAEPLVNKRARALVVNTLAKHADERALQQLTVEVDILRGDLVVNDLVVDPDTSARRPDKAVFSFTAPRLELDISPWRLLIGRLHLTAIRLDRPIIRIDDVAHVQHTNKFDLQQMVRKMHQGLSGYLSSVGISDLVIEQAELLYRRSTADGSWEYRLSGLDLELAGLVIDEDLLDTPERMSLKEFRIGLGAHAFSTPRGNVQARLERLDISLAERSIDILGLHMEIAPDSSSSYAAADTPVQIALDGLHIHGIDLHHATLSDTLVAERILLEHPKAVMDLRKHEHHKGVDTVSHIASILSEFLPQQRLDTLDVVNGSLHLTEGLGRSLEIQDIDMHLLVLQGSAALAGKGFNVRPPQGGWLRMTGLAATEPLVALTLDSLCIDLGGTNVRGSALRLVRSTQGGGAPETLNAGRFGATGLDLAAFLTDRSLYVDSLYIDRSVVDLSILKGGARVEKEQEVAQDIHLRLALDRILASTGSPTLNVRNIHVQGRVSLRSARNSSITGSLGQLEIHGTGFRFPEGPRETHRLLYIDQLRVALNDLTLDEHASGIRFSAASLDARTGQHGIVVEHPMVHMKGRLTSDLSAGRIELIGLDYVALLERRGIYLQKILLDGADIVLDLPEERPPTDVQGPDASVLLKHVHAERVELHSRSLRLQKQGELLLEVDSFYYVCRDLRADLEAWTNTNMAFRRDGLQYGGKRLRLAPPGSGITGSVSAFDVDLGNDHARMTDLQLRLDRPDLQATVTVPRISSAGFDPHFVDRTNVIALGHMVIDSPVIDVQLFAGAEEPPRGQGSAKPTGRSPYRGVHARSIAVQNGTIGVGLEQSGSRMEATLMDLSSQLNDLDLRVNMTDPPLRTGPISVKVGRIDLVSGNHADSTLTTLDLSIDMDATTQDEHGALRLDGLRFGAEAISAPLPGGMHLSTGRIDYVPQLEQLSVRTINYAPIAAQANFASEREYRADALVLEVDQLLASGLDLPTVIATKKFDLRHLSLEGVRVNDLRDHRLPIAPYRYKPMLHRTIADLEQHVRIDTVQVRNAQVEYGEIQPVDTARIRLTTVQASILNICSGMARCNQPMTLRAAGLVQDEGEFEVMMDFEVDHPKDLFTYRFSLGPMDLTALDGMLAPAAHITIESGRLDTLYLVAEANDEVAIGNMRMFYRKLHLRLLDRHNEYNGVFPVVESWVANSLVRTNHSERHRTRPAAIYFERLKDRSIFNYVIKQSLSGAGGNVRLPDHKGKVRRLEDEELKYRLEQDTGTP